MDLEVRPIGELSPTEREGLFQRSAGIEEIDEDVRNILDRVRAEGDVALRQLTREFDGVEVGNIDVTDEAERAWDDVDRDVRDAIQVAADNIMSFHERAQPSDWRADFDGRELGRRFRPLDRAGIYVPGGGAAYPSSALMGVIPATVAGVEHVAVATPPAEATPNVTLAAAHHAGADAVYSVGGAQAVAGLAYGTETIARVEKVVGPGNRWVTAAKAAVQGDVEIDFLAGPSELLVVADGTAPPDLIAADLLAQAEHDTRAAVALVTTDADLAAAVADACDRQVADRERADTIRRALSGDASGLFLARSTAEAIAFAEEYAPEHLAVVTADEEAVLDRIHSVGSAFLGPTSPVAAGDYATGPNHVLPTGGTARVTGGLSVEDFLHSTTVQRLSTAALSDLRETITTLATAEGLEGHAASVDRRFDD